MLVHKMEKEVRSFLGCINYITRFISHLMVTCQLIFYFLRKKNPRVYDNDYQEAFDEIKRYLLNPPLIVPLTRNKHLFLY